MQQAVCYVEIKKKNSKDQQQEKFNHFHLFTAFYFTMIDKKMQAPESKALNHILSFTDKNCSSSQASTCMLCELSALDQTST